MPRTFLAGLVVQTAAFLAVAAMLGILLSRSPAVAPVPVATRPLPGIVHSWIRDQRWTLRTLRRAGFPRDRALLSDFIGIAGAESGYYPHAVNVNTNGTIDRGLFQINSIWLCQGPISCNPDWLYGPVHSAEAARYIWQRQGIVAWSTWDNGAYRYYWPVAGVF